MGPCTARTSVLRCLPTTIVMHLKVASAKKAKEEERLKQQREEVGGWVDAWVRGCMRGWVREWWVREWCGASA